MSFNQRRFRFRNVPWISLSIYFRSIFALVLVGKSRLEESLYNALSWHIGVLIISLLNSGLNFEIYVSRQLYIKP